MAIGIDAPGRRSVIEIWDVAARKPVARLRGHEDIVQALAFSPDGKTLASGSWDTTVRLWDVGTGRETAVLRGPKYMIANLTFTADGKRLVFASYDRRGDPNLWVADVAGKKITAAAAIGGGVRPLAASPDGSRVATYVSGDNVMRVWDVTTLPNYNR